MTAVSVRGLRVSFGEVRAVDGIDLEVAPGEFVCLVGPSGSGKSTLLRCLNGLQRPTSGEVRVAGADPCTAGALRGRIGFVFQNHNLVGRGSVLTNVLTGALARTSSLASLLHVFPRDVRTEALHLLARFGLEGKARARARTLSGGQQQRVAIARALMQHPVLVLADEPVASLDPKLAAGVLGELKALAEQEGIPVLCSIHVVALARRFADRIVAVADGRVVYDGSAAEFTEEEVFRTYGYADEYGPAAA
ncbi:phosphonate ABC transporter ATP-binding protein [Nonomuraea sp. PA05]|uniref:phosphonate ABC transporter ATP-binding protein n=1 Tax=Nonomuraea sp. PA05 TaxID=2604466 RepID=UPI0011D9A857|nr:phosphonate ABC transporter ATP-binding protein [Nonomuraea sp. PA05]TYB60618.1 phosphonate ABC transporter ATP-binding protein [Nonomuraea sp. PA05]